MATLEKIRSKSVFLFTIIILALLAFILGDALTSGRSFFGPGDTIAKVGGEKIKYQDYSARYTQNSEQAQQSQRRSDPDELAQSTLQQLVFETLLNREIDNLGITVTDKEITAAMTGDNPHPAVAQFIYTVAQQLGLPEGSNGRTIIDVMNNPARYNFPPEVGEQIKQMWKAQEDQLETQIKQAAFGSLVSGLFTSNDIDAQAMYDNNMTQSQVAYVSTPFSAIADDQVEYSDVDLKNKWAETKSDYFLPEETRTVYYIVVNIQPSVNDLNEAEVEVDNTVAALATTDGLEALAAKPRFTTENIVTPVARLKNNADLRTLPDSALAKGRVHKFPKRQNTFTIAKVLDVTSQIDSINISMLGTPSRAAADSLLALINGGRSFASLVEENQGMGVDSVWQTLVGAPAEMKTLLEAANVGVPFIYSDSLRGEGAVIYNINRRHAPVNVAEVAVIKYVVDPSAQTISDIKTGLNSFLASNSKADLFSQNADSLYRLQHAEVTPSSAHIGNVADSRQAVKWTMDAKAGQVSKIFENQDHYLVVALKNIYEGEYRPANAPEIQDALRARVLADKKAAKLSEQYPAGKYNDLQGYAQAMNTTVQADSAVVFTSPRLGALGFGEYAVQGKIAAAPQGKIVGPVQANNSIVYFMVNGAKKEGRPFDARQDGMSFMQSFGISDYYNMLVGDEKVKNNSLEFVQEAR